jgi:hypothetical protein
VRPVQVASRNFGIAIGSVRTDALVPLADMLNHYRPRQTKWAYDNKRSAFLIHSLTTLRAGQQVYDSYGKKCNSRFLLNYGFAVEHNSDDDIGQNHNEVRHAMGCSWGGSRRRAMGSASISDYWSIACLAWPWLCAVKIHSLSCAAPAS